eukprot:scaffold120241_cov90-Phaeocystis_antarctica.AAC.2
MSAERSSARTSVPARSSAFLDADGGGYNGLAHLVKRLLGGGECGLPHQDIGERVEVGVPEERCHARRDLKAECKDADPPLAERRGVEQCALHARKLCLLKLVVILEGDAEGRVGINARHADVEVARLGRAHQVLVDA